MFAITININAIKQFKLKTIDSVKDFIESFDDEIKVYIVSAERTLSSENIHYHVACDGISESVSQLLYANKIWNETVVNELMYVDYIEKGGNYKYFNDYHKPLKDESNNQYQNLLNDIYVNDLSIDMIRNKYPKLYLTQFQTIIKMISYKDGGKL